MKNNKIKKILKEEYGKIASQSRCCCSCGCETSDEIISKQIGYSNSDIKSIPDANLGLGCGNPIAISNISESDVVLDLGSGAGFDSFLASKKVGSSGKVIGIDMTKEMVEKARKIANKYGYKNVEFKSSEIENLPIEDNSIDVIISNCVINLIPDKLKVFQEAKRVLREGGKMYISDIVLLEPLNDKQKQDTKLLVGCVSGALLKEEYFRIIKEAGLEKKIISENKEISEKQYRGIALESLNLEITKIS